ncbi:aspartate/glutamate racemase family protein [Leucothrix arctica]|uniref:Hydantoin racemase n=1 Tax=Leucothrix arctica TaxID=1481894 RepID=A0A317CK43_9GAMM|nr:aspartate/glutamate racemase family protein [Leucothrix arctica]PWQ96680.1 Asp/Glu/hydantoin racemase [Leucothrix arctica]
MKITVINPNSTVSMTQKIESVAKAVASPDTIIFATNPDDSPASIEGYYDEALSLVPMLKLIEAHPESDAFVIACFDDTGLDAARCITDKPVIGIGEAAYHMATLVANKFSVITTLERSVPALEHNLQRYGLASRCVKVRSSNVAVLELENPASSAQQRIRVEIDQAISIDRAEAIVLGCAGMADLADTLSSDYGVPVLDGVRCAVALAESLVRVGLKTSKTIGYSTPITIKV